jgi:hypothetical protein
MSICSRLERESRLKNKAGAAYQPTRYQLKVQSRFPAFLAPMLDSEEGRIS